jgi:hypothetical protein
MYRKTTAAATLHFEATPLCLSKQSEPDKFPSLDDAVLLVEIENPDGGFADF